MMSKRRTERLLSIVVLLLSARRYLTAEEIRRAVIGYPEQDAAFKRTFERDKDELRELGIPLETGTPGLFDDEVGYRIPRQDYELPDIHLTADEAAVLGIAARVWRSAELSGAAFGAMLKLTAASSGPGPADGDDEAAPAAPGIVPRLTTQEPAFGPLWEAVRDRRPVTFSYLASGRAAASQRELEPWGVVSRRGHWYVAGHDRAARPPGTRVFRMSRISGPVKMAGQAGTVAVPPGTDVRELVKDWGTTRDRDDARPATLMVRAGAGLGLRRPPARTEPSARKPGWDLVTTRFADLTWFAQYVASFGPDAEVTDPPDLRDAVIACLKGVLST
ncbi:MAG TPA: WYL domain-containing protein [Trebonia sp.]|jgi:proteasome accessory factor B|nr:WYL domain-containing protein [Trebonia sp.]